MSDGDSNFIILKSKKRQMNTIRRGWFEKLVCFGCIDFRNKKGLALLGGLASQSSLHTTKFVLASIFLDNFSFYKFCLFMCRLYNENLYANIGFEFSWKNKCSQPVWLD